MQGNITKKFVRNETQERVSCPDIPELLSMMGKKGQTLGDIGCNGWIWESVCNESGLKMIGIDTHNPSRVPSHAQFFKMDGVKLWCNDTLSDFTVASHIIEHLSDPANFVLELGRITKPGGFVWIEAPSELSLSSTEESSPERNQFESFWSDATHVRPYPPGALYRLGIGAFLIPVVISREVRNFGAKFHVSRALFRRPDIDWYPEKPRYVTFRGVEGGVEAAWNHVWPERPFETLGRII